MSYKTNIHFNRIIANDIDASYVELAPFSGQQSFYHKASALLTPFYNALFSYNTPILFYRDGQLIDTYYTDENGQFTTGYYVCGSDWTVREIP